MFTHNNNLSVKKKHLSGNVRYLAINSIVFFFKSEMSMPFNLFVQAEMHIGT